MLKQGIFDADLPERAIMKPLGIFLRGFFYFYPMTKPNPE